MFHTHTKQQAKLSSSLCSFLHSPVDSSLLGPNILLSTLFSNTLRLRSSLNVSDHVSHPYKTTGKITFLYISVYLNLCIFGWQTGRKVVPGTIAWRVVRLRMEERPPIWRVAANISIISHGQPTRGGPPAWGFGKVLTTPHRKNWYYHWHTQVPQTWTDNLVRPKHCKRDMRFSFWNIWGLYWSVSLTAAARELADGYS